MKKTATPKPAATKPAQTGSPRAVILKTLRKLAHSKSLRQVWDDWIEAMALAFANMPGNAVHLLRDELWEQREARYMTLVRGYRLEEWRELAGLLGVLTDLLEQFEAGGPDAQRSSAWRGGGDPLGELFMELEFANADTGQFFTPWDLTMLKATLTLGDLSSLVDDLGFVTLEDPAVGSGTTLLAAATHARTLGVNPQTQMRFHGRDISASAVHMAFVNCSLRGLPAIIEHGDTLRMEIWSKWVSPMFLMGGWKYRRQRQPETPPRELLQAALGLDLPDALLVLRVSELPNPEPAVRAAAAALAAAEAEDAGPEEFA